MVIDMGGEHIGVSYGKIKRTPGQLDCERAREIFEGVQPQAVRIGLTVAEDIDEISENLREAMPDVLHLSGDIEGISPAEVAELKSRFPELKIMEATDVPCIIAGGLDASNVAEAIYATHPYGVDSFSLTNYDDDRADTDRCKDPAKVEAFIKAAKDA